MYKELYESLKAKYLNYLSGFSNWNELREDIYENRYNSDYLVDNLIQEYSQIVATSYLEKYPFLKRYNANYTEYQEFIRDNEIQEIDLIKGVNKLKLELINVKESELYFPRFKIVYQMHSALHSIAMVLKVHNTKEYEGQEIILYELPQFTHVGDKEYVMYIAEKLKLPLVIISRNESMAFNLQINGVPKLGAFGRYCTRIYKIEPSKIFYKTYFYDFVEKMKSKSKEVIMEYLNEQTGFEMPKKLSKKDLLKVLEDIKLCNFCKESLEKSPRSKLIKFCKANDISIPNQLQDKNDYELLVENFITKNNLVPENQTKYEEFEFMGAKVNNIVQCIGINKYQSTNRSKMNPNIEFAKISKKEKGFMIYECFPLFEETFEEMEKIFNQSGLLKNPYEIEYKVMETYRCAKKEVRMGCIFCPHKDIEYYIFLKKNHDDRYYFCHLLRTICSAKTILQENKEYYYYNEIACPKKKLEYIYVM